MAEAPMNTSRRKIMQHAVALFCQEAGFHAVDRNALEMLTEMFQAILYEMGRSTRTFTELAGRVEPTVGDFTMALIDMGLKVDPVGLRGYARRHGRPMVPAPAELPKPKVPVTLTSGEKRKGPSYIPDHFPPMPDSHAYIRTPTHKQPITDYAICREKTSQQKRDLERSLSKFFARTSECYYLFPENKSLFPLMAPKPVTYLDPLIPRDQLFEEDDGSEPLNYEKKEKVVESTKPNGEGGEENSGDATTTTTTTVKTTSWELIDNPFLKQAVPRPKKSTMGPRK